MKRSYKRLIIFFLSTFLILFLNSFVSNILSNYNMILFLGILLIIFKFFLGFEKDRHRYTKDVFIEIIVFLLIYFILYYLFGLVIGFARVGNYYNFLGFKNYIIPSILVIIITEILRYMLVVKSEQNKWLLVLCCLLFIGLDITNVIYYQTFQSKWDSFLFVALTLFPAISKNIMCTYLSLKVGYKPVIFYLLVIKLYPYLLPIVPDPNEYFASIIHLIVPILLGLWIYRFFKKDKDEIPQREKQQNQLLILGSTMLVVTVIVYFTCGYFHFHAIAIASGSMTPTIHKGDVVVIEKIDKNYDRLREGQVIAYEYNHVIVVHRLQKIVKEKEKYYFYTKGDANAKEDGYAVEEGMVIGIVNIKIPYLGIPTVWLNEL